jgi:alkylglycerol monooxygenase
LMDGHKYAMIFELLRTSIGLFVIITTADWFGLNAYASFGSILVAGYFVLSSIASVYFLYWEGQSKVDKILA